MSSGRFTNWQLPDLRVELDIVGHRSPFTCSSLSRMRYLQSTSTLLASRFLVSGLDIYCKAAFYKIRKEILVLAMNYAEVCSLLVFFCSSNISVLVSLCLQ